MPKTLSEETERLKRVWEREAPTYLLGTRVNNGKRCTEVDAKTGY
jgi:hypothetical protein